MNEPWWEEPNRAEGEAAGLRWVLRRGPGGRWCGYVGVGVNHPAAGRDSTDLCRLAVHGGITWAKDHFPFGPAPDGWWIGFDCGHAWDVVPKDWYTEGQTQTDRVYRTIEFAKEEVAGLAEQLAQWPVTDSSTT